MPVAAETLDNGALTDTNAAVWDLGGSEGKVQAVMEPAIWTTISAPTFAPASTANGASYASGAVNITTGRHRELLVEVKLTTGGTIGGAQMCSVGIVRSLDGGSTFEDTPGEVIGSLLFTAINQTVVRTFSTKAIGALPSHFKIAVLNNTGGALNATAGNHAVKLVGVS